MGNSIEEDMKILKESIIEKKYHIYNKDLKIIIERFLSNYKRALKENEELKEDRDKFKKALGKRIIYCNELEKDLFENCSNYVIPKQIVKDKIEELIKEGRHYNANKIEVLQELLEGRR